MDGAVEETGGGTSVVGGALEDVGGGVFVVGGAVDEAGGGVFVLVAVGDVGAFTLVPPGEGNEASWVGRILLGVFPLDCRGSVMVSTFDGEGVPFSSASLTFFSNCPSFRVSFDGVSLGESACFFSD